MKNRQVTQEFTDGIKDLMAENHRLAAQVKMLQFEITVLTKTVDGFRKAYEAVAEITDD